jgi:transcription-repair coupling factor (superfamily II helicase)
MKDLEIRGAGNILGAQQSGHIAAVGFNLYCKLLQRAVDLLKQGNVLQQLLARKAQVAEQAEREDGEKPVEKKTDWRKELPAWQPGAEEVHLDLPFTGNIPEEYVESAALRLDLFRRIGLARRPHDLKKLENEMRDRFGPLPEEAALLLRCAEVRVHARSRGIDHIEVPEGKVVFRRRGTIINPLPTFPRIRGLQPLEALDVILAHLSRVQPLAGDRRQETGDRSQST